MSMSSRLRVLKRQLDELEAEEVQVRVWHWSDKIMRAVLESGPVCSFATSVEEMDELFRAIKRDLPFLRLSLKEERGQVRLVAWQKYRK